MTRRKAAAGTLHVRQRMIRVCRSIVIASPKLFTINATRRLSGEISARSPKRVRTTAVQDNPEPLEPLLKSDGLLDGFLPFDKEVPVCCEPACPNQLRTKVSCSAAGSSGGVSMGLCSHLINSR